MRNQFEFRGYRARVDFDPVSGCFVYRREPDPVFATPHADATGSDLALPAVAGRSRCQSPAQPPADTKQPSPQ